MANRYKVTLTEAGRALLTELTRSGKSTAAKFIYARALLLCDAGEWGEPWKVADAAEALGITTRTVEHLRACYALITRIVIDMQMTGVQIGWDECSDTIVLSRRVVCRAAGIRPLLNKPGTDGSRESPE